MNFELNAGKEAKCLKIWDKTPTNIEIINEIFHPHGSPRHPHGLPEGYELYVFRFSNRVELWQDLFLLSDHGAEKVEKLVDFELVEIRIPNRDDELINSKPMAKPASKPKEKNHGFER